VIQNKPMARIGTSITWALLPMSVSRTKPGMPGMVQISGERSTQTATIRYMGWAR
jgi:hypothetical protein